MKTALEIVRVVTELRNLCDGALEMFKEHGDKDNLTDYMTGRRDACISILNEAGL